MKSLSVNLVLVFSIMAASGLLRAQQTPVATPADAASTNRIGPKIAFATPLYEWGKVASGESVKYDFIFTNTGDALLEINGVVPGCHCTQAGKYTDKVEPGKTGVIPIQFDSTGFPEGPITRVVTVTCNDKTQPTLYLQMKGTIWRRISFQELVTLNLIDDPLSAATVTNDIVNNMDEPITLSDPEINMVVPNAPTNHIYTAELKTVKPGREFNLTIKAAQPVGGPSAMAYIRMKTSSTNAPEVRLRAMIIVGPALETSPAQITVPAGTLTNTQSYVVTIQNKGSHPVKLSEPAVNLNGPDAQLKEVELGRQYSLTVTFPAGFVFPPGGVVEVSVKSDRPESPLIKVPVIQTPTPTPGQ